MPVHTPVPSAKALEHTHVAKKCCSIASQHAFEQSYGEVRKCWTTQEKKGKGVRSRPTSTERLPDIANVIGRPLSFENLIGYLSSVRVVFVWRCECMRSSKQACTCSLYCLSFLFSEQRRSPLYPPASLSYSRGKRGRGDLKRVCGITAH
jgi:hypothetical protein